MPAQVTTVFPGVPSSVAAARRFVSSALERWEIEEDAIDVALLLTSELVTNAYRHGHTEARVSVVRNDATLRVEVADTGSGGRVELRHVELDSEVGRGLQIVDALSHRWGSMSNEGGTLVWFELLLGSR